jgi:hypothetical protein
MRHARNVARNSLVSGRSNAIASGDAAAATARLIVAAAGGQHGRRAHGRPAMAFERFYDAGAGGYHEVFGRGVSRDFLARQPGYVSTRLHRAPRPDARFQPVDVAEWTSAEAFRAAAARMQRELTSAPPAGLRFAPARYRVVRG